MMNPNHLALYQALFQQWNYMRFPPVFSIRRETTLQLSKIGSAKTYYKCLKELQAGGYIKYYPAAGKYALAKISMMVLVDNETTKQLPIFCTNGHEELGLSLVQETAWGEANVLKEPSSVTATCTIMTTRKSRNVVHSTGYGTSDVPDTVPEVALIQDTRVPETGHTCTENGTHLYRKQDMIVPYSVQGDSKNDPICEAVLPHSLIKQKKDKDFKSVCANVWPNGHTRTDNNSFFLKEEKMQQQTPAPVEHFYPTLEEAITFFKFNLYSEVDAKNFHYHYSKTGWKLADGKPITNWKRIAERWMLNRNNLPDNVMHNLWNFNVALYTGEEEYSPKPL